jgi:hypothetical protein
LSLNNNIIEIIYLQVNYNVKKLINNSRKKIFKNLYKINTFLAYFFRIFFLKPRPRIRNIHKHKVSNIFIFLLALNVAAERGQIFKVKFIEFIYNFYKQIIDYIY